MKRIICFCLAVLLCVSLTSCCDISNENNENTVSNKYCNMVVIETFYDDNGFNTVVLEDVDTGVLYLWFKSRSSYGQTLIPLYNADGTLKNISDYN